jgi:RNA polymerase sigma-70 factor (ECF subfamily)
VVSASGDAGKTLVECVADGDAQALALLYRQHHEAVRAFARRLLGNPSFAEDLVHDVFIAAPAAFSGYRGTSEVRTFLIAIAVNKAKHHMRAASRYRRAVEKLGTQPPAEPVALPDADRERRELCDELQRALDQLSDEHRIVVILCAVEDRSAREASEIVGVPENTIRTRLFHAKRKLRDIMGAAS